ncbi:SCO family protein [Gammaproteobacteria bacterium]|nr:SCO family protein [Gammaproteobacteria bacterium]
MDRKVANTVVGCVAFMFILVGLSVNRILSPSIMSNEQLSENGLFVYDVPRRFREFSLIDHNENAFTSDFFQDNWTLVFFGYTYCPDVCPITLATISQFSGLLEDTDYADDTQVAMISVDPQRDTPEILANYMNYFNEDYVGATGEYIDIFNLASQLNIAFAYQPAENDNYLVSHSGEIILINPNGHFHGFFKVPHDPNKMLVNYTSVRETW